MWESFGLIGMNLLDGSGAYGDARAMSEEELNRYAAQQAWALRQADWPLSYLQGLAQYVPSNQKPLDERFSDFKKRLAAAIEKQRKLNPSFLIN